MQDLINDILEHAGPEAIQSIITEFNLEKTLATKIVTDIIPTAAQAVKSTDMSALMSMAQRIMMGNKPTPEELLETPIARNVIAACTSLITDKFGLDENMATNILKTIVPIIAKHNMNKNPMELMALLR